MASYYSRPPFEIQITLSSAKDIKNVNWRHGDLKPYAVLWVEPSNNAPKTSTKVAPYGDDTNPTWDETIVLPVTAPVDDSTLFIDIVHVNAADGVKPLIGSAKLQLRDIINDVGVGERVHQKLKLKRPSGRPHGKLEFDIVVRDCRYCAPDPYQAPPYSTSRDYPRAADPYYDQHQSSPYGAPPPASTDYYAEAPYGAPPTAGGGGYPYNPSPYGGRQQPAYGEKKKESKYGMGTGVAVGAVAGVLGGLALAEGFDYVEDKIADDAAEKVEGYHDDDDCGYGDCDEY